MVTLLRVLLIVVVLAGVFLLLPEGSWPAASARREARQQLGAAAEGAKQAIADVDLQALEKELRETGCVVRVRSARAARSLAEATADVRTTAAIEAQFLMDPRLSALAIDVNTTDGTVTLAGRVGSASDVAHAVELALRHENVREVISTLQVAQPDPKPSPRPSSSPSPLP